MGRRATGAFLLGVVASFACGPLAPPPTPPASGPPSPSSPSTARLAFAPMERPRASGCELLVEAVAGRPVELSLFSGPAELHRGESFALAHLETASILVPSEGEAAFVEGSGFGLSVGAYAKLSDLRVWLSPSRPLFGGLVQIDPGVSLELAAGGAGTVRVRLARHGLLEPASLPIEEIVSCADVRGSPPPAGSAPIGREMRLRSRVAVSVFASPTPDDATARVVIAARPSRASARAIEIERRDAMTRVFIEDPEGSIVGWVSSGDLETGAGERRPTGSAVARSSLVAPSPSWTCPHPLELAVLTPSGEARAVGALRALTPMAVPGTHGERDPRAEGLTPVTIPALAPPSVASRPSRAGGSLVARSRDLEDCGARP